MSMRLLTQQNDPPSWRDGGKSCPNFLPVFPPKEVRGKSRKLEFPQFPLGHETFPPTGGTFL